MLSIIISSYQPQYYKKIEENIEKTCDVEYQIIKIDNPGKMGVSEAYNKGVIKAKYPYLLFIHEDILIHTVDWGSKLINHLNQKNVGVIGVAGSSYIVNVPSSWYLLDCDYVHMNFIQNSKFENHPIKRKYNIKQEKTKVIKLDGMFLGMTKDVYNKYKFNEEIKGFHGYDTDISLRIANNFDNYVIDNIIIEHFSSGVLSKDWINAHKFIKEQVFHPQIDFYDERLEVDMYIFYSTNYLKQFGFSVSTIKSVIRYYPSQLSLASHIKILKFFLKIFLKR